MRQSSSSAIALGLFLLLAPLSSEAINNARNITADFSRVDAYVKAMPKLASAAQVAARLGQMAKTDWEKARAIYDWVCLNIAYDTDAYFGNSHGQVSAQSTFESGKSVCRGYSELALDLASALGLRSVSIEGYSKGYSYVPGRPSQKNHAWNAFLIDGSWYLMDTTWGAGYIGDDRRFRPELSYTWFAMDPQLFLYTHFSDEPAAPLQKAGFSKADFDALAFVPTSVFESMYASGFTVASQKRFIDALGEGLEARQWAIVDLKRAGFSDEEILAVAKKGPDEQFLFEILELGKLGFARPDLLAWLIGGTAPKIYAIKGDLRIIEAPRTAVLQVGKTYIFRVESKTAFAVAVICGKEWTALAKDGSVFSGEVKVSGGTAKLALRFEEAKTASYSTALAWEVR
jgi:hypothetical protein